MKKLFLYAALMSSMALSVVCQASAGTDIEVNFGPHYRHHHHYWHNHYWHRHHHYSHHHHRHFPPFPPHPFYPGASREGAGSSISGAGAPQMLSNVPSQNSHS